MKLSINYNVLYTYFLSQLSTFGWKGGFTQDKNHIVIESESILSLKDYLGLTKQSSMSYEKVEQMILHLGNQLIILTENNLGQLFFSLDDISIVDETFFIITDVKHVVPMNKKEQLCLNYPLKMDGKDMFLSPELMNVTALPIVIPITSTYYSLALLCCRCLGAGAEPHLIKNTKMYFFLLRCLEPDPDERYFLYI